MVFKFAEEVPEAVLVIFKNMDSTLDTNQAVYLAKSLIDFLGAASDVQEQFGEISQKLKIPLETTKNFSKAMLYFLKGALKSNLSTSVVEQDLLQLGFSEDKSSQISLLWDSSASNLTGSVISQTLTVNQLVDLDWRFGGLNTCYPLFF